MKLVVFITTVAFVSSHNTVTIETPSGKITGLSLSKVIGAHTYSYNEFRRLPYAKPPIGNLRFQKPVKYGCWDETYNATYFGSACIQTRFDDTFIPNKTLSEDCLFLNIYVPTNLMTKKSVMIYIHGGSYLTGTGMLYNGAYMASVGNVIIVTINYRLGVFGFLSTGNENARGNYGLWDQKMAIEWVHNNIESFGGDPDSVTIFGESAGGFSVTLHSIIPQNKGLFSRVIAQSGVATSFVAMEYNLTYNTRRVIDTLKCTAAQQSAEINCLRQKSATDIQNIFNYLYSLPMTAPHVYLTFAPRVDGELFMDNPEALLRNKCSKEYQFFRSLDFIVGNVESEGSPILYNPLPQLQQKYGFDLRIGIPRFVLCDHLGPTLAADRYNNNSKVATAICQKYGHSYNSMHTVDYFGDLYFYSRSIYFLNFHSEGTPTTKTFQYLSAKRTIVSNVLPVWFEGAGHTSELPLLFPLFDFTSNRSEDMNLSLTMMKYWTNFAKNGDPNGNGVPQWPLYKTTSKSYQVLDSTVSSENDLYKDSMDFWLVDIPKMINSDHGSSSGTSHVSFILRQLLNKKRTRAGRTLDLLRHYLRNKNMSGHALQLIYF